MMRPMVDPPGGDYRPTLSPEHVDQIRKWHERAYAGELVDGAVERTFEYLGFTIVVPPGVMPITPMSHLLGEAVLREAPADGRVLDMGTGSGVNAILAASRGARVVAVDISEPALEAARANAVRNGVAERVDVRQSDVFEHVDGVYDLIVFDPPFRWFKPRTLIESVMADEGYGALTRFFRGVRAHLAADGRMLLFFGTSGDLGYMERVMAEEGFVWDTVAHDELTRDGWNVDYFTFLVT
jgi:release factor glutamine methyltransferase